MVRPWLARARPWFGTISDHEIARRLGVARTIVSKARRRFGIAPAPRKATTVADRSWVPAVRHLFGKIPDRELGKRVGRSEATVGKARRELGIARCQRRPKVRGRNKVPLTATLLRSKRSAPVIARITGIAVRTVYRKRRAMGTPTRRRS